MKFKLKNLDYADINSSIDDIDKKKIGLNNLYLLKLFLTLRLNLDISNEEFYKLVMKLYDVKYDGRFDLEYIESINRNYYTIIDIPTTDIRAFNRDSYGDKLPETKYNQKYVHMAVPIDFKINPNKIISLKEFKELLNRPDVYYFGSDLREINIENIIDELFDKILPTIENKLLTTRNNKNSNIGLLNKSQIKEQLPALIKKALNEPYIINGLFGDKWEEINFEIYKNNFTPVYSFKDKYSGFEPMFYDEDKYDTYLPNHKAIDDFVNGKVENLDSKSFNFLVNKMKQYIKRYSLMDYLESEIYSQNCCLNEYCLYRERKLDDFFDSKEEKDSYVNAYRLLKRLPLK